MQMEIEAAGDRLTARIKGELDHHSAAQARAQLDALLTDERIRELRIDLRGLTFMDSSGLGVILGRYRVIAGRGGRVLIGGANRAIDRILRMAGIYTLATIEELTDVRTAISEAVTNAIIHGYSQKGGTVRMDCSIDGDVFTATITDKGRGIADIEQAMQPFFTSAPDLERSGMGFCVMQAFMDSVDVKSTPGEGTKVTMTKRIGLVRADG